MNSADYNISYIMVPFFYPTSRWFDRRKCLSKKLFEPLPFENDIFLGYIEILFKNVQGYKINKNFDMEHSVKEVYTYFFDTGMGFVVLKSEFENKKEENYLQEQSKQICELVTRMEDKDNELLKAVKKLIADDGIKITLFHDVTVKKCLAYSMAIGTDKDLESLFWFQDTSYSQDIDERHSCKGSSQKMSIQYCVNYKDLDGDNREEHERFRERYENDLLMMFLLLHHERQMYFYLREQIVANTNSNLRKVKKIKDRIVKLLTCYSYKIVSEEVEFQKIYECYRDVLNLSEYENALSELVFRLNEDSEKSREKKMTLIEILLTILGLLLSVPYVSSFGEKIQFLFK